MKLDIFKKLISLNKPQQTKSESHLSCGQEYQVVALMFKEKSLDR